MKLDFSRLIVALCALMFACPSESKAARYVSEGFDYNGIFYWGTGYGLLDFWNTAKFDNYSMAQFKALPSSLTGIGSLDHTHLERPQRGQMATIYRELAEPMGAPGTTKYLGCLLRIPITGQVTPTGIYFGVELMGRQTSVYMGGVNSAGPKFMITAVPGVGGAKIAASPMQEGVTYFCVLKLEFGVAATTCSLYIGGNEFNAPDAILSINAGLLTTLAVTGNYTFGIDEVRIADSIAELSTPPSRFPPQVSIASQVVQEGNSGTTDAVLTARLEYQSDYDAYIDFQSVWETATSDDFVTQSGRLHFAPGETEKQIRVPVIGDTAVEPDETFRVRFFRLAGISYSADTVSGVPITILNDDVAPREVFLELVPLAPSWRLNWLPSTPAMPLQQSSDLVHWENVQPPRFSNENPYVEVDFSASQRFYRFGPP